MNIERLSLQQNGMSVEERLDCLSRYLFRVMSDLETELDSIEERIDNLEGGSGLDVQ